jgi:osmotically-inducible protein OsmY
MKNFKRISVFIAAAVLVAGCASTSTQESTGQYMDDSAITTKVKAAIFNDPSLKSAEINVETFKRQVQLSGFVSTSASMDEAVSVARGVGGVLSVKNDMRLK